VSSRGLSLTEQGFIHASTAAQLPGVLAGFYADLAEVALLVLDVDALAASGSPVRWDQVPGSDDPFPHVYGEIPSSVVGEGNPVVAALPLAREPGQPWSLDAVRADLP
jgi:glutathione S-transferase